MIIFQFLLLVIVVLLGRYFLWFDHTYRFEYYMILIFGWLVSLWLSYKHKPKYYQRKAKYILAPFQKALIIYIIIILIAAVFIMSVRDSFCVLLTSVILYTLVEYICMLVWIRTKTNDKYGSYSTPNYAQADLDLTKNPQPKRISTELSENNNASALGNVLLQLYRNTAALQLSGGDTKDSFIGQLDLFKMSTERNLRIIALDTRINDFGDINAVFRKCYENLIPGGYLVLCYHDRNDIKIMLKKRFSLFFYYLIFPIHFCLYEIFPKMRILHNAQNWLTKGRNKVMSWIEVHGRLAYCGFDVDFEEHQEGMQYIVAKKTKTPSDNPNPSYYIFIKLDRVSLYGNIIKINKVRTMYPYSEFLQKKIFEQKNIGNAGKFVDDPRITKIGKIFRKYWIDEIPQLIDWLRGEIKLVGIRAMSQHFFSLYPKKYQELYYQVKPGIISPIFDEKTDGFEQIVKIEQEYLENYLKAPIKTDFRYFFITLKHILKGTRSK